jgi:threonyl-tRNA synthetase
MIIVRDKEIEANSISVRTRTGENMNGIQMSEFLERIRSIIQERGLGL